MYLNLAMSLDTFKSLNKSKSWLKMFLVDNILMKRPCDKRLYEACVLCPWFCHV